MTNKPSHCWVLRWQSPSMPALSFWYFEDRANAEAAGRLLQGGSVWSVQEVKQQ